MKTVFFFFFKQKTAYEIVSRDWSSDVCSSDLAHADNLESLADRLESLEAELEEQASEIERLKTKLDRKSVV